MLVAVISLFWDEPEFASHQDNQEQCMEEFSKEQERVNASSHFVAAAIGLIAIPLLVWVVMRSPDASNGDLLAVLVYGVGFVLVFTFSALYHFFSRPKMKHRFEIWDHIGIYFMIAGTYTPLIIAFAEREDQVWMLAGIWSLAAMGSVFKLFFPARFRILSMLVYVVMGLLWFVAPQSFLEAIPAMQFNWILAGALVYTAGLLFYLWAFFKHHHAVWHLFVFGGAACHYVGILGMYL